jgi:hypothetical protein
VTRDPFVMVPTTARLWAAAVLAALSLGLAWSSAAPGRDAPVRVFVVAAVGSLLVAALRARTPATQRLARLATGALTLALVLSLGHRTAPIALVLAMALILAAPPAWRRPVAAE